MTKTILGVFTNRAAAEDAIAELEDEDIQAKDISIIMQDQQEARDIANSTGADVAGGAATGATTGAVVGGLAGLLVGIGAIAIPGIGPLLIAGPLAAGLGLTGATATTVSGAVTGAVAGGLIGALMGLGLPREDAELYQNRIREGAILLAVPAARENEQLVRDIFADHGATDVTAISNAQDRLHTHTRRADIADAEETYVDPAQPRYTAMGYKGGRTAKLRRNR